MMAITRRQVINAVSVLYLLVLTVLAAIALRDAHYFNLPIADIVAALTLALPPLAGVAMETVISMNKNLAAKGELHASRPFQITVVRTVMDNTLRWCRRRILTLRLVDVQAFFLVYEAVIATLAGIHISPPGSLNCALRERWEEMFSGKDAESILRIQDGFNCCGLKTPRDMAFPFQDSTHGADACMIRYDRNTACIDSWRDEEQKVAIMLLVVPLAVFLWKVAILLAPSSGSEWLPSIIRLPDEEGEAADHTDPNKRPAIEYRTTRTENAEAADSVRAEIVRLNNDSNLASQVEGNRSKPNGLWHENWRDTQDE